ncbi:MAG: SLC13 family permease [Lachnospiraceae bacterium]|nr:SLC13 family permease [Lachnospiraceae bacterium]
MIAEVMSVAIFLIMFVLIILEKWERHQITLVSGLATIVLVFGLGMHSLDAVIETLNIHGIFKLSFWYQAGEAAENSTGINWATIIFVAGMMVMVEGMAHVGFFRWLCMKIAKLVRYQVIPIYITFMILSGVLAMFIDSITVILFLAAVTIELAQLLKFNPIPMILSEIFCANLGGSATMCGDPPNIIIGTSLGYSFADFIQNTGLIAGVSLVVMVFYFYFVFRKELKKDAEAEKAMNVYPEPDKIITDKRGFVISTIIFLCAVVMLITHAQTGLTVAFIGVFIAAATLIAAGKNAITLVKKVDYKTLSFFIGLFIVVGGLEQTGVLEIMAGFIEKISKGDTIIMTVIIITVSAVASAFVDNIPFAATMIPVIKSLASMNGIDASVLAWALAMGTDIGGSATPIGASANVVGIAVASKEGYIISWGKYCKVMVPASVLVILISIIMIYLRYF